MINSVLKNLSVNCGKQKIIRMKFTPSKINMFTMLKLPSAYLTGVRLKEISDESCKVNVKLKWMNQNPFKSMFWAVQGMAAELSTGVLMMQEIQKTQKKISMLVTNMNANFSKKAKGRISFECNQGYEISDVLKQAIETKEGQVVILKSQGVDEQGDVVSSFEFEWSVKVKS